MVFPTISAWQNSKTDWSVVRRCNAEHKPQAALTTSKTLFSAHISFLLFSHGSVQIPFHLIGLYGSICPLHVFYFSPVLHVQSFPQIYSSPLGVCVSFFFPSLPLSGSKVLDAHFPVMMMMEKHLAIPFLHFVTPFYTHYSSGTAQELLDAEPKVTFISQQHLALPTPSSFLSDPMLSLVLWLFSWCFSDPSVLVNSITSWAYSFEGPLNIFMMLNSLTECTRHCMIWPLFIFPTPSTMMTLLHHKLQASWATFGKWHMHALPWASYYPCILPAWYIFILGPHFLQVKGGHTSMTVPKVNNLRYFLK